MSVIFVGYNSEAAFAKYLPDFASSSPANFQMILVDNGSMDRTVTKFREIFPHGDVIETGENLGFAKAVNIGAGKATGDWLLLLNPDAAAKGTDIVALHESVVGRSECAVVGPLFKSGGKVIPAGRFPTAWRMFLHATALSVFAPVGGLLEGHYIRVKAIGRGLRPVDWVTGGCLLVRRDAWTTVGGLTERWFMYGEDLDFCYQVKRYGYEVLLNQDVTIFHEVGQSSSGIDGKISVVWLKNLFDFYSSQIVTNSVGRLAWKSVVSLGFFGRSALFAFLARMRRDGRLACEAKRFRIYAAAIRPGPADFKRAR
ncbi:glycosyltransferase family 2 protein [Mycolicibacterium sp. ELW1]|uniref:glycosyltransferase family 2 protein n=1 Tax=Mycobacteriaceae TaxID=1762 RepID=UPI00143D85B8|nr:glycosyltransferase family 2 protein [Mycobacterium sp. ELW1]